MGRPSWPAWRPRKWTSRTRSRRSTRAASTCWCSIRSTARRNIDVNVSVGSIFSVLRAPTARATRRDGRGRLPAAGRAPGRRRLRDLRPGDHAGADAWATASHGFTLDPSLGEFMLTHPEPAACPSDTREFAINASQQPLLGAAGEALCRRMPGRPRRARAASDFNMRWIASHGGRGAPHPDARRRLPVPARHARTRARPGRLRLLYEANPIALLDRAGRRPRQHRPRSACSSAARRRCTSASAWSSARATRSSASSATTPSPQAREVRRIAAVRRAQPVPAPEARRHQIDRQTSMSRTPSHHRHHRLVRRRHHLGDAHLREHLPARGRQRRRSSKATASIATTASR